MHLLLALAQETDIDDGGGGIIDLPSSTAEGLVWVLFLAVIAALWISTRRRREQAEAEYWQRHEARRRAGAPPAVPKVELGVAVGDRVAITEGRFAGSVGAVEAVDAATGRAQIRIAADPRPLLVEVAVEVLERET